MLARLRDTFPYIVVLSVPLTIIAVNESEEWRMARAIKNGKLKPQTKQTTYNPKFSQFSTSKIAYNNNQLYKQDFVGLLGPKGCGKTSDLLNLAENLENAIFLLVTNEKRTDLHDLLYNRLQNSIFRYPKFLSG